MAGNSSAGNATKRLYILARFSCIWIVVVCFRLVQLQVLQYGDLKQPGDAAAEPHHHMSPRRGVIYDRNGYELAMSIDVNSVFAVPVEIPEPETTASIAEATILQLIRKKSWHACKASRNRLPGWRARSTPRRASVSATEPARDLLPARSRSASIPSANWRRRFSATSAWMTRGSVGIEHEFNDDLTGIPGRELISVDARASGSAAWSSQPEPGQNVVLTIDRRFSTSLRRSSRRGWRTPRPIAGTVVVQNPRTGEILALANRPTFNPNVFKQVPCEALKNRAVSDVYEPGSVFKIVTYSAAIEQHVVKPGRS